MIFKKGHIVPRWCGVKISDRKARHQIVFGCNVEVIFAGKTVIFKGLSDGPVILIARAVRRPMKNGSYKRVHVYSSRIVIQPSSCVIPFSEKLTYTK